MQGCNRFNIFFKKMVHIQKKKKNLKKIKYIGSVWLCKYPNHEKDMSRRKQRIKELSVWI